MTKIFTAAFAILIIALNFSACKKKENKSSSTAASTVDSTQIKQRTQLLTSGNWKMTEMTVSPGISSGGTITTDWFSKLDTCSKDNFTTYYTNKEFVIDEGATKCNPNDPQTTTGTWVFNSNATVLSLTQSGGNKTWNVVELTNSNLKINYTASSSGETYTYSTTFTH